MKLYTYTCCSHGANAVFVECESLVQCSLSHFLVEHVTASKVENPKVVLCRGGKGGVYVCIELTAQ